MTNPRSSELDLSKFPSDKVPAYLKWYDREFAGLVGKPVALLELGIAQGHSLRLWQAYFPAGHIVGVDLEPPPLPGLRTIACDQADTDLLASLCREASPAGYDVIIDDCSHLASLTAGSLEALWPLLKSGGLYVIEDWGTGYYGDWPDGRRPWPLTEGPTGHDAGMTGLVKRLVDTLALANYTHGQFGGHRDHAGPPVSSPYRRMAIYHGMVVLEKA